jgi:hypothetical protein
MKNLILPAALILAASAAHAATCGTFAAPTACSITVGGNIQYTFSAFSLNSSAGSHIYAPSEIGIDVSTGGGNSGILTFSKLNSATGIVFFANPGESNNFTLQYDVSVSPLAPGTASFATPSTVAIGLGSATNNGVSSVQMILSGSPSASCQAIINVNANTPGVCNTLPGGVGNTITVGNLFNMAGNSGNTSINNISNRFNASFAAAPPDGGVPETYTWAMFTLGAAMLAGRRLTRR